MLLQDHMLAAPAKSWVFGSLLASAHDTDEEMYIQGNRYNMRALGRCITSVCAVNL